MKRYLIAGLTVDMEVSGRTEKQAEPYRVSANGPADITLNCDARRVLELNPDLENLETAQYMGTGAYFSRALLRYQGTIPQRFCWTGRHTCFLPKAGPVNPPIQKNGAVCLAPGI